MNIKFLNTLKEQKDTSFGQSHILCIPRVFEDVNGYISDEYRPLLKCTMCQMDPTRINDAPNIFISATHELQNRWNVESSCTESCEKRDGGGGGGFSLFLKGPGGFALFLREFGWVLELGGGFPCF